MYNKCELCIKRNYDICNCVQMVIRGTPIDFYLCSECYHNIADSLNTSLYNIFKDKILDGLKQLAYRREER